MRRHASILAAVALAAFASSAACDEEKGAGTLVFRIHDRDPDKLPGGFTASVLPEDRFLSLRGQGPIYEGAVLAEAGEHVLGAGLVTTEMMGVWRGEAPFTIAEGRVTSVDVNMFGVRDGGLVLGPGLSLLSLVALNAAPVPGERVELVASVRNAGLDRITYAWRSSCPDRGRFELDSSAAVTWVPSVVVTCALTFEAAAGADALRGSIEITAVDERARLGD